MTTPNDPRGQQPPWAPQPTWVSNTPAHPIQPPPQPDPASGYQPPALPPTKKHNKLLIIGGSLLAGLLTLCVIGVIAAALDDDEPTSQAAGTTTSPIPPTATAATLAPTTPAAPTTATRPATPAKPALPADTKYTGHGDKIVKLKLSEDNVHIAAIHHKGGGNFVIWSLDAGGDQLDLMVNTIGSYTGVRPVDFEETPAALKIEASGSWTITVKVAQKAPVWKGKRSGKGDGVLIVDPDAIGGLTTVRITHTGSGNFAIWAYGDDTDLLVNEIGKYNGETLIPDGTILLDITAGGSWTIQNIT